LEYNTIIVMIFGIIVLIGSVLLYSVKQKAPGSILVLVFSLLSVIVTFMSYYNANISFHIHGLALLGGIIGLVGGAISLGKK